jgi:hypothetical protein
MNKSNITVAHRGVGEGGKPVPTEIIAESIVEIAQGMKRFRAGRLNDRALVILLSAETGIGRGVIETVLKAMADLEEIYLNKKRVS